MLVGQLWYCHFREADMKTSIPRQLVFTNEEKIWDLARRGVASMIVEDKRVLEEDLRSGRGSVWLHLIQEQYGKLKNG
jgi:hypothetical protein